MTIKRDLKVTPYKFGELSPSSTVDSPEKFSEFQLQSFKDAALAKNNITEDKIRTERKFEKEKAFSILPLVREHRGLVSQEDRDIEEMIQEEVKRRVSQLQEETYNQAFKQGVDKGYQKAYDEASQAFQARVNELSCLIDEIKSQSNQVIEVNKKDSVNMIKNLVKWISLKEIEDEDYLVRLLNKLIHEMNTKNNLLVRVNEKSFKYMPEVIKKVEEKVGSLPNIRVEVDLDQDEKGIVLESENGIIDGSISAQFKSLDKIFEEVNCDG